MATLPLQYGILYSDIYINLVVIIVISTAVIATIGTYTKCRKKASVKRSGSE